MEAADLKIKLPAPPEPKLKFGLSTCAVSGASACRTRIPFIPSTSSSDLITVLIVKVWTHLGLLHCPKLKYNSCLVTGSLFFSDYCWLLPWASWPVRLNSDIFLHPTKIFILYQWSISANLSSGAATLYTDNNRCSLSSSGHKFSVLIRNRGLHLFWEWTNFCNFPENIFFYVFSFS